MSIQSSYLTDISNKLKTDIAKAIINDTIEITDFVLEEVTDNVYELKFDVLAFDTTQINNIKLTKSDNTVIISDDVDIPVTENEAVIRYLVTISEVTS